MSANYSRKRTKPLAQVLFEASPNVGWDGPWLQLDGDQRRWWEHFADIARAHLVAERRDLNSRERIDSGV